MLSDLDDRSTGTARSEGGHVLVSIVIPTYRHRDYVCETLSSVLAQTFRDFEIILVNDGSPDDTADVVREMVQRHQIRYIEQANAGQANARNVGIAQARGAYIALLDDDDLWPPDKLAWQVALLEEDPSAVMVYGGVRFVGDDTSPLNPGPDAPSGDVREAFLRRCRIWSPGQTLIRHATLKQIGLLDETVWGADDWDLYIRLAAQGNVIYRNLPSLYYRIHRGSASQDAIKMYRNQWRVFNKHMGRAVWKDRSIRGEWRGASSAYCLKVLDMSLEARRGGHPLRAVRAFCIAVAIKPSQLTEKFFWMHRFWPLLNGRGWDL